MVQYKKINKPLARRMYNMGYSVYLLPCKVNEVVLTIKDAMIQPVIISFFESKFEENKFDRTVNEFEYYNCNAELGYYAHYYVTEQDYDSYKMCNIIC